MALPVVFMGLGTYAIRQKVWLPLVIMLLAGYLVLSIYWLRLPRPPAEADFRSLAQTLNSEQVQPADIFHYLDYFEAFCLHYYYQQDFTYPAEYSFEGAWKVSYLRDKNRPWQVRRYPDLFEREMEQWSSTHSRTVLIIGGHFAQNAAESDAKISRIIGSYARIRRLFAGSGLYAYELNFGRP